MKRLEYPFSQEWHGVINQLNQTVPVVGYRKWMHEARSAADELPRLAMLFAKERTNTLPNTLQMCSKSPCFPVNDNYMTCCLGIKTAECAELKALETMKRVTPEEIDVAKAWTCVAHIIGQGGDVMREGYVVCKDDRMYWDKTYQNLAEASEGEPE